MKNFSIVRLLVANICASASSAWMFAVRAGMMALNNLIFFTLWLVLFRQGGTLGGWDLERTMVLFGISATAFGLAMGVFAGFTQLPEMVRDGRLNAVLLKPTDPLVLVLASRSDPAAWGNVAAGLLLVAVSGALDSSGWLILPSVVTLAATIVVSAGTVIFCLCFWMESSDTMAFRIWEFLITMSLYPEGIFPIGVRVVLYTLLPAAFIGFVPVEAAVNPSASTVVTLMVAAAAWGFVARAVFNRGVRRFASG